MCRDIDCGCGQHAHDVPSSKWHHHWGCCYAAGYGRRHFRTRDEVISELEEYLKELRSEIKGVEERIAEVRKEA